MYYPRSFPRFIILGLALIVLPLVLAIAELISNLDRLNEQSERAVLQAAQAGRASRTLVDQTIGLERLVRQFLILGDPVLLDDYARVRRGFQQTYRQLALLGLDPEGELDLDRALDNEARLFGELQSAELSDADARKIADGYATLAEMTQGVMVAINKLTDREIDRLRQTAEAGRDRWIWLAVVALLVALGLAFGFTILLARPVRQIDLAIRRMGTADFDNPVRVDGPQELRYLGQRLEWMRSRLHELEQQQTRFLRQVSHELKTPLTVVREGAELLRDRVGGQLSPEQDEIVRILRENTLQLQKLIEDLLRYQQTRTFEAQAVGPVELAEVVRRVVREQKLTAYARVVTIEARLSPVTLAGDAEKLRVIVDNLVSNAIKYSPRGGTVTIRLLADERTATVDVLDEGPGVAVGERERIFESFYQSERAPEGRVKGSGLGLAIAREYVMAHGGTIVARDRPDGKDGACFRVELPVGQASERRQTDKA